jgi:hypothetical protein
MSGQCDFLPVNMYAHSLFGEALTIITSADRWIKGLWRIRKKQRPYLSLAMFVYAAKHKGLPFPWVTGLPCVSLMSSSQRVALKGPSSST